MQRPGRAEVKRHDVRGAHYDQVHRHLNWTRDEIQRRVSRTRRLVSQHRPGRRPDRAASFPGRLSRTEVAPLRARHARRPARQDRARYRLQRRLLLHRDEAARRRPRGRHRFRRAYLAQARFAAEVCRRRHRVPPMSCLRAWPALRERFDLVCSWACSTTCAIRCWRSTCCTSTSSATSWCFSRLMRGSRRSRCRSTPTIRSAKPAFSTSPAIPRCTSSSSRYAHDPTNWWIPNRACAEAMLRSAGFEILDHPEDEVFVCRSGEAADPPGGSG